MKGERITGRTPLGFEYTRDLPEIKDYRVQTPKYARALEWTTEPPTVVGLYRAKRKDGDFVNWVEVGEFTHGNPFVLMFGSDVPLGINDFTHWLGPLPVPEPPNKGE